MAEQTLYAIESHSSEYFGLKIVVDQERKLDEEDRRAVNTHVRAIQELLQGRTLKLDPNVQASAANERQKLLECFPEPIYANPVPNEYHGVSAYGQMHPWFEVTTKRGIFLVGWRKRVIHLEWTKTVIMAEGRELFPERTMTMDKSYLHASDYEDLRACVERLMAAT